MDQFSFTPTEVIMSEIIIYQAEDNKAQVEVTFEQDTVWLSQKQIAALFGTEVPAINKHIKNILREGELMPDSTISKMEIVAQEGGRSVRRKIDLFNLDMIISVGYRINSTRATQFRIWATQTLKEHLLRGYTLNEKRLLEFRQGLEDLERAVQLIQSTGTSGALDLPEVQGLLDILGQYTQSFILLNRFDKRDLQAGPVNSELTYEITYPEARAAIAELKHQLMVRKEASALFANEKDDSFQGILGNIVQTFDGQYVYPSIEEQAAHLLYFVIKNHPFNDGNKRTGAFLFVWFLEKNRHRFKSSGELKINDNALVALALLVAQSDPAEKELMIKLIANLIISR